MRDYLTVDKWAEHQGLHYGEAPALLEVLRHVANTAHTET